MPDLPILPAASRLDGVAELADLLFSGLGERPMWGGFLAAIMRRLGATGSAFVISAGRGTAAESAVLAPCGQPTEHFAGMVGKAGFADLPFDQPRFLPLDEGAAAPAGHAVLRLRVDGDGSVWLVCTAASEAALAADWREVFEALLPLLQRIVRIYLVIGETERRRRIAEHVLETSGVGVVLVDSSGAVLMANATAHAIMANTGVLGIHDGRLRAARQADQKVLQGHIRQKAEEQAARAADPGCYAAFALLRDDSPLPITVMVRPGPPFAPVSAPLRRTATVILRDPARRLQLAAPDLEQLFDLSPAEARLARLLADGLSMEEAAVHLGVSRNTVRSQLQAIFAKTGTNRQGELVRLLLSSAATLAQRDGGAGNSTA
jgi:DNA-binding CsgD family transcriptional regulator